VFTTARLSFEKQAFVAQRIEHLTTDQKVGGSSPSKRTFVLYPEILRGKGDSDNEGTRAI